jgi:hypothetical protein
VFYLWKPAPVNLSGLIAILFVWPFAVVVAVNRLGQGHDDMTAIMLAIHSPQVQLLGVSTVMHLPIVGDPPKSH